MSKAQDKKCRFYHAIVFAGHWSFASVKIIAVFRERFGGFCT
jgi:hypothetical protein